MAKQNLRRGKEARMRRQDDAALRQAERDARSPLDQMHILAGRVGDRKRELDRLRAILGIT